MTRGPAARATDRRAWTTRANDCLDAIQQRADGGGSVLVQIAGGSTRNDAVHHHPVTEASGRRAQNVLADDRAAGLDGDDAGVVADRAHVADMVRQTLQLGHDAAQQDGARRDVPAQRRFDGHARRRSYRRRCCRPEMRAAIFAGLVDRSARAERLDALVHIAQPLLQPGDGLAVGGEAEMAGLDDAGMNGADRDLMQARAFNGQELVAPFRFSAAWRGHTP